MALNKDKVFEVPNGFKPTDGTNTDGPIYTGGPTSPVGLDFPVGTFYVQNNGTGPVLWKKWNTGNNDWIKQTANDFYQKVVDLTETSTTSTTVYSTKLTLVTPNLPLGDYRLEFNYKWRNAGANRAQDNRIQRNSSDALTWIVFNPNVVEASLQSGFINFDGISGVQTITLQFKVNGSGTTAFISNARMDIVRIS